MKRAFLEQLQRFVPQSVDFKFHVELMSDGYEIRLRSPMPDGGKWHSCMIVNQSADERETEEQFLALLRCHLRTAASNGTPDTSGDTYLQWYLGKQP